MVYRVYVEKKPELALEAASLAADLRAFLHIDALTGLPCILPFAVFGGSIRGSTPSLLPPPVFFAICENCGKIK